MAAPTDAHGPERDPGDLLEETLGSGLAVVLRESHAAPVAEFQVWARVGSADEAEHEAGLAHFHEHMLFKGTERRGVGAVAGAVEGVGGRINAFTTFDTTCYHATLPSSELDVGVDVLTDIVRNSVFDPEEVAREIDVVLEEIRRSEDDPHHVLSDAVFAEAFRVHPYGAPILGSHESVSSITREKLLDFYSRWYAPDNLVVVAAGDFDPRALRDRIERAFEGAGAAGARRTRANEPDPEALRAVLLRRPFERASLDLSWRSLELSHPDTPLLDLLAFVLGEGDSSRLMQRVKEEAGLVDRVDASSYTPLDPGLFGADADLDDESMADAVAAIVREVEILRREPVPEEELDKARANVLAARHWERESVSGMARKLGSYRVLTGDACFERRYLERIENARAEDLLEVAHRWLAPERLTVGAVVPESADPGLDASTLREAVDAGARSAARLFQAPRRAHRTNVPESRPPAPTPAHAEPTGCIDYELQGGIRLHVLPRHQAPIVALRLAMQGGQLSEGPDDAGITSFLAGTWLRGTTGHSASDFARRVESLAADIDGFSGRNSVGLTLDCTADRFDTVLELLAEVVLSPAFAPEEIERERSDTLAAISRREDRLGARAFDLFTRTLYGPHPYGRPLLGSSETVTRIDAATLRAHQARIVRPGNLVVSVVGDVDPDQTAARIARHLAPLSGTGGAEPLPPAPDFAGAGQTRVEHKDRAQAHLVVGYPGLTLHDPDREALEVVSQVLGGQGGRLFLQLRDRQGLAYTVNASNIEGLAPGFFAVYIATSPEKFEEARVGIRDELQRLLDAPPGDAELDPARRYLIGNHVIDQQRAGNRAMHIALDSLYGLGPEGDRDYAERIRSVSGEDVLRVARRIFGSAEPTLAAIRPDEVDS